MKVEVGESLCKSYLRNRKCSIVQLNWKAHEPPGSSPERPNPDSQESEDLFDALMKKARAKPESDLDQLLRRVLKINDKKSSQQSFGQWMKQAEVDALGLVIEQGEITSAIAMDVAFHESGLNYGGKDESAARVVKKLLRTTMLLKSTLAPGNLQVLFASPKCGVPTTEKVVAAKKMVLDHIDQTNPNYLDGVKWRLLVNDDFYDVLVQPICSALFETRSAADTSELMVRSMQLLKLGGFLRKDRIRNNPGEEVSRVATSWQLETAGSASR